MSVSEKPIVLLDLNDACHSLGLLIFCSSNWIPEEECTAFAAALRPHLRGAAAAIAAWAKKNEELLALCKEDRTAEVVERELADLEVHLSGRTAIGPRGDVD